MTHWGEKVDAAVGLRAEVDADIRLTAGVGFVGGGREAIDNVRWPLYAGRDRHPEHSSRRDQGIDTLTPFSAYRHLWTISSSKRR